MTLESLKRSRLVALFFLGALLLNFPILSMASQKLVVAGFPILFAVCFLVWAMLIVLVALVVESKKPAGDASRDSLRLQPETPLEKNRKTP